MAEASSSRSRTQSSYKYARSGASRLSSIPERLSCTAEGRVQVGDRAAAPPTKWVEGGKREDGQKVSDFWGNMNAHCGVSSAESRSQTESCPAHPSLGKASLPAKEH